VAMSQVWVAASGYPMVTGMTFAPGGRLSIPANSISTALRAVAPVPGVPAQSKIPLGSHPKSFSVWARKYFWGSVTVTVVRTFGGVLSVPQVKVSVPGGAVSTQLLGAMGSGSPPPPPAHS
jgi:hypothetical protein